MTTGIHFLCGTWDFFSAPEVKSEDEHILCVFYWGSPGLQEGAALWFTPTKPSPLSPDKLCWWFPFAGTFGTGMGSGAEAKGAVGAVGSDEAGLTSHLWAALPFVSVQNLCELDRYVLILILDIHPYPNVMGTHPDSLLVSQILHHYHLSLRPLRFPFDSSGFSKKLKDLLGSLFPSMSFLPLNPQTLRKNRDQQLLPTYFRKWFSFLWKFCSCYFLIVWYL